MYMYVKLGHDESISKMFTMEVTNTIFFFSVNRDNDPLGRYSCDFVQEMLEKKARSVLQRC